MKKFVLILILFSFLKAQINDKNLVQQKFQAQIDSIEQVIAQNKDNNNCEQFYQISRIYFGLGSQTKGFAYALKAKELSVKTENDSLKTNILDLLGQLYSTSGLKNKAEESYKEMLKFKSIRNNPTKYLHVLYNLAFNSISSKGDSTKTIRAFQTYINEAEKQKNYQHLVIAYYSMAIYCYHENKMFEKAIELYKKSLEALSKYKDDPNYNSVASYEFNSLNNIGDIYERMQLYDSALEYYLKSLERRKGFLSPDPVDDCVVLISVSSIYNIKGDYDSALKYLNESLAIALKIPKSYMRYERLWFVYNELYKVHKNRNDNQQALEFLHASIPYKDSLTVIKSSLRDSSQAISSMENQNIIGKIESEKELLERRNEIKSLQLDKAKTSRNYLVGGLIFAILSSLLILSRYRLKIIANRNITTISKIGQDITSVLEFEDLLYTFYEDSNKLMEVDAFGLGLLVDGKIKFRFFINNNERLPEFSDDINDNYSPAVKCLGNRKELLINDLDDQPEYKTYLNRIITGNKLRSALYLPLISKDKPLGILTVLCNKKNTYIDQHLNMLKTLASYLTIALDNSRVYSELNSLNRELKSSNDIIKIEQEKSDRLLLNILPAKVAAELKEKGSSTPEVFKNVAVMFTDLVNFTKTSANLQPQEVINELNDIFSNFDRIISKNGCLRIKTIGDAYLAVAGMPEPDSDHTEKLFKAALEIIDFLNNRNQNYPIQWQTRIGIHSGDVVGGIIGIEKYIYDIFGDTVNVAFRMEQLSMPMQINVTGTVYAELRDKYKFSRRGGVEVKGRDGIEVWWCDGVSGKLE